MTETYKSPEIEIAHLRGNIARLNARVSELERVLKQPLSDDDREWIDNRSHALFREWYRRGVRPQIMYPQDGIEYWVSQATQEWLAIRAALTTQEKTE